MTFLERVAFLIAVALLLGALLAIPGCSVLTPAGSIPVSQTLSPQAQAVQTTVNEANVLLTAAANVVSQNVKDGIWTREQGKSYVSRLKALAADVDRAQALLRQGEVLGAQSRAELARKALVALHREIAQRGRNQ